MTNPFSNLPTGFVAAIRDASDLLDVDSSKRDQQHHPTDPLPSLLDQCRQLLEMNRDINDSSPIRTLHHLACTGGTLISKCLAAMPNVQLLSEVHPFSKMHSSSSVRFFPTDLSQLARISTRGVDTNVLAEMFVSGISVLHNDTRHRGLRLVLREHSHSQFCVGEMEDGTNGIRRLLEEDFELLSIVTVRHPMDSFLSLLHNGWQHFHPFTPDEYARRYIRFLDHHANCNIVQYEEFISDPDQTMKKICELLEVPFDESFTQTFQAFSLSGDSGRSGTTISERERRPIPDEILQQASQSTHWQQLCTRLNYN